MNIGRKYDRVGNIIKYEAGEASDKDTLELFSNLLSDGTAWHLQGSYGRRG